MGPQIFGVATMNTFLSCQKATSLMWAQFLGKQGGLIRGGLLYHNQYPRLTVTINTVRIDLCKRH